MTTTLIVAASLALAAAFSLAWLLTPSLRRQIEDPKHWFQNQLQRYDRSCHATRGDNRAPSDEPN